MSVPNTVTDDQLRDFCVYPSVNSVLAPDIESFFIVSDINDFLDWQDESIPRTPVKVEGNKSQGFTATLGEPSMLRVRGRLSTWDALPDVRYSLRCMDQFYECRFIKRRKVADLIGHGKTARDATKDIIKQLAELSEEHKSEAGHGTNPDRNQIYMKALQSLQESAAD